MFSIRQFNKARGNYFAARADLAESYHYTPKSARNTRREAKRAAKRAFRRIPVERDE